MEMMHVIFKIRWLNILLVALCVLFTLSLPFMAAKGRPHVDGIFTRVKETGYLSHHLEESDSERTAIKKYPHKNFHE
jgi:hypothetical protein